MFFQPGGQQPARLCRRILHQRQCGRAVCTRARKLRRVPASRSLADGVIRCFFKIYGLGKQNEKAPAKVDAKAELEKYRLGVKVLRADVARSAAAAYGAVGPTLRGGAVVQLSEAQQQRMAQTRQDLVAMLLFLFFAMNTFPLTPLLLPATLKYIPEKWLVPSSLSHRRVEAMRTLERRRKALPATET
mmetsp:Transcript_27867/g.71757  ORF Transcript_27867/g.71757 Transcript_27867/m.71757 type:complete len:188 (-) Transcript_27867:166-729(-)